MSSSKRVSRETRFLTRGLPALIALLAALGGGANMVIPSYTHTANHPDFACIEGGYC